MNIKKNTVSAQAQVSDNVVTTTQGGKCRMLFVGNSITRHSPKPDIGWFGDWGMQRIAERIVEKILEK